MLQIDLDALFATAPSPYVLLDRDLRMIWANDAYLTATGRDRAALIGRLMLEVFAAPADSVSDKMLRGSFKRVLASGRMDHLPLIPYPITNASGQTEERYWTATQTPILDGDGRVEFILQNTIDVTDLYRAEKGDGLMHLPIRASLLQRAEAVAQENLALGDSSAFFQGAFEQAPGFIAVLSGPEHVFQIVNQAYTDLIGRKNVIGQPVREALPDIKDQGFLELLDQVYQTGTPVSMKRMPALVQPNADRPPVHHFIDFIFHPMRDETGLVTGIFVQGHDVTGQIVAENSLTATREKFRTMAQAMPNQVWTASPDGALNWLNERTYEYTGFQEGDLFGEDWARVVHPEDLEDVNKHWAEARRRNVPYETEFRIRKADGSYRWHLVRASPLRTEHGEVTGWVGTNTDIAERKNTETEIAALNATLEDRVQKRNRELEELNATLRQSQKMEAIGNLAGGIAHDFNNLLQIIIGNLQLTAREMPAGSPGLARIEQAMQSSKRAATLASQLLSFARRQPLAPVVINLGKLVGASGDMIRSAVGEGVDVDIAVPETLWNVSADPGSVENAVLNLAINARDAMAGQGALNITLGNVTLDAAYARAHSDVVPGEYVRLCVKDEGAGMSPEIIDKVFEPFFTTKAHGQGTGLGLSMVYGFARQSGGHVTVSSTLGAGTAIAIYLPRCLEEAAAEFGAAGGAMAGGSETILLVEDDEGVRRTAFELLTSLGYTVLQAPDADRALALLTNGPRVDLLFTDVIMPGKISGRGLAEKVQEIVPGLPVLFTSGYAENVIAHGGRLDAGVRLLGKPYSQAALAKAIREVLGTTGQTLAPLIVPPLIAPPLTPEPQTGAGFDGVGVLLCEDNLLIRLDMAEGLRAAGCTVLEAGSAHEALDLFRAEAVAVLITDIGLPDQSGEDLARQLRDQQGDLPVIFATGGVDVSMASETDNCHVLRKPFSDADLLDALQTALNPAAS